MEIFRETGDGYRKEKQTSSLPSHMKSRHDDQLFFFHEANKNTIFMSSELKTEAEATTTKKPHCLIFLHNSSI